MEKTKKPVTGMLAYIVAAREIRCSTLATKVLLLYYSMNVDANGEFFKSLEDIAWATGLAKSSVQRLNEKMKNANFLTWKSATWGSGSANRYKLNLKVMQVAAENSAFKKTSANDRKRLKNAERQRAYRTRHAESVTGTPPVTVTQTPPVTLQGDSPLRNADTPCSDVTKSVAMNL